MEQSLLLWGPQGTTVAQCAVMKGKVFKTEKYLTMQEHNSYTIELKNGSIRKIISIISLDGNVPMFVIKLLN